MDEHGVSVRGALGLSGSSVLMGLLLLACEPAREAPRVERTVVVDGSGVESVTTDLGFGVTLSEVRVVVRDFQFATAGELHTAQRSRSLWDFLVTPAYAHPGHYEGGEVIGEAPGRYLVDWLQDGGKLGTATLLVGTYTSANFTFARATEDDGLDEGDPLAGHTARFVGRASKDELEVAFEFTLDSPEDRLLVGAPFEVKVAEAGDEEVGFRLLPHDELGGGTLFDGIDFALLDADDDGRVTVGPTSTAEADVDAYNVLRRTFQTHNHYGFALLDAAAGHGGAGD